MFSHDLVSTGGPHSATQFIHHRAGKFIFKGNLLAEQTSSESRPFLMAGTFPITGQGAPFCQATLRKLSACSDRAVNPYLSDERRRAFAHSCWAVTLLARETFKSVPAECINKRAGLPEEVDAGIPRRNSAVPTSRGATS
jgi:hypothetical protein